MTGHSRTRLGKRSRESAWRVASLPLCAVLAFLLLACGGSAPTPEAEEGAGDGRLAEDLIAEAYFRSYLSRPGAAPTGLVFMSFGRAQDPPFMFMKRFKSSGFVAKPVSECDTTAASPRDKATGEEGVLVVLNRVTLITPKRAIASGHFLSDWNDGRSYTCVVEKGAEGRWRVTSSAVTDLQ